MNGQGKREYEFTIVLAGVDDITTELENVIFEAGCDDGGLAMCNGVIFIEFDREANSYDEAVASAIRDIKKAGVGVDRVIPGFPGFPG